MDQILDAVISLYEDISALLGDYLLPAAGLVLVLVLLLILIIARRRRAPYSRGDGDAGFLEVGPEPVIVYHRAEEQEQSQEPSAQPRPEPAPGKSPVQREPEAEKSQEPVHPDQEQPEPPPAQEALDEQEPYQAVPTLEELASAEAAPTLEELAPPAAGPMLKEPEPPVAEPVLDPEPMPDAESEPQPGPEPEPKPQGEQPLPYLQSELANDALKLFSQQGFQIEEIVYQGIYGGDFIAVRPGVRAYVQVKDWKKKLTENTVSEVSSYAGNHDCNQAIIVTPAKHNRAAAKAAARLNVLLWNKKSLKKFRDKPVFPQEEVAAAGEENK